MAGAGAVGIPRGLMVQRIQSLVEEGFWDALRRLKLDVLGTDDSPIPITGPLAHNPISSLFVRRIRDLGRGTNADPMHFRAPLLDFRRAQPALVACRSRSKFVWLLGGFAGVGCSPECGC